MYFSIIIANFNGGKFLESAIKSVLSQSFSEFELIVVDGGSSDNSIEIIKRYESSIGWWISEKDSGQSEAFNKGFRHAKGKFLTWLNSDDLMLPGTLLAVSKKLKANPGVGWATGNMLRFYNHSGRICEATWGPHWVPFILQRNGFPLCIYGPTSFWDKNIFESIGPLNERLHYTMDYDYWRRLSMHGIKYVRVNHTCWAFRMHENSKTAEFGEHKRSESRKRVMLEERLESEKLTGFRETRMGWLTKQLLRVVDFSIFVALFRRVFIVGRPLQKIYCVKINI